MSDQGSDVGAEEQAFLPPGGKFVRFALMGALGCLAGAVLGEVLLLLTHKPAPIRPAQNVCLLIDCSGSMLLGNEPGQMDGAKLAEVQRAAGEFVARQDLSRDMVGVVGFGSSPFPASPLTQNAAQLSQAIQFLAAGGGTAMDSALRAAASTLLNAAEVPGDTAGSRNILLFTDGQPDDEARALAAAKYCQSQNIRVVAIATGDADVDYLARVTGDRKLVFPTTAGNFGESFKQAEEVIYGGSLVQTGPTQLGFVALLFQVGGWTALLALGVAVALVAGQNLYLRRPALTAKEAPMVIFGGLVAGLIGGMAGQLLPGAVTSAGAGGALGGLLVALGKVVGWAILGALLGRGLAFFVPNLHPRRAWMGGGIGGAAGAVAFLVFSQASETLGRFLGAAVLGALIGMMIALVEAVFRQWWLEVRYGQKEVVHVSLGATPVRIGSDNRACTIFARGARPLAAQFQVVEGQVVCLDFGTEKSTVVQPGDQRTIGHVTVTVRASRKATEGAAAGSAEATAGPRGGGKAAPAAPPPPKVKKAPPETPAPSGTAPATAPPATPSGPPATSPPQPAAGAPILSAPPPPKRKGQSLPSPGPQPRTIRPVPPPEPPK